METVKQNVILERTGIFSQTADKRFEYTMERKETEGKKILVICTNPASDKLLVVDMTTARSRCATCLRRSQRSYSP